MSVRAPLLLLGVVAILLLGLALVDGPPSERPSVASVDTTPPADRERTGSRRRSSRTVPAPSDGATVEDEDLAPPEIDETDQGTASWWGEEALRVVSDATGEPIQGATVRHFVLHDPTQFREGVTEADGGVLVPHASKDYGRLVRAPGFASRLTYRFQFVAPGEPIRLEPGNAIRVRVTDARDGRPLAGAEVYAWDTERGEMVDFDPLLYDRFAGAYGFRTDASGVVPTLNVPRGRDVAIVARAPDRGFVVHRLTITATTEEVVVVLGRGGTVQGRVLSPAGRPAPGVPVFVVRADDEHGIGIPKLIGWDSDGLRMSAVTTSDADGRFRIDGIPVPAHSVIVLEGPNLSGGLSTPFRLEAVGSTHTADVVLVRPAFPTVRLRSPSGDLVGIAQVTLRLPDGSELDDPVFGGWAERSGSGVVSMGPHLPGARQLVVVPIGPWRPLLHAVELVPGTEPKFDLVAEPGRSLTVEVVDAAGDAVDVPMSLSAGLRDSWTEDRGGFQLDGLGDGPLRVEVSSKPAWFEPTTVNVRIPETTHVRIEVALRPAVVGRFEAPQADRPGTVRARIRVGKDVTRVEVDVAKDGSFRFPGPPPGVPFVLWLTTPERRAILFEEELRTSTDAPLDLGRLSLGRPYPEDDPE